jgi:hypothetical protein
MSLTGSDVLRRRVQSIARAIENDIFEEAGKEWIEQDFVPEAQRIVRVDTGDIRESIGGEANKQQIRVYAASEDAPYEEDGNHLKPAAPFMRPALQKKRRNLSARIRKKLKDIL